MHLCSRHSFVALVYGVMMAAKTSWHNRVHGRRWWLSFLQVELGWCHAVCKAVGVPTGNTGSCACGVSYLPSKKTRLSSCQSGIFPVQLRGDPVMGRSVPGCPGCPQSEAEAILEFPIACQHHGLETNSSWMCTAHVRCCVLTPCCVVLPFYSCF